MRVYVELECEGRDVPEVVMGVLHAVGEEAAATVDVRGVCARVDQS